MELKRTEEEFWQSSLAKIFALINIHKKLHPISGKENSQEVEDIRLSNMPGFI